MELVPNPAEALNDGVDKLKEAEGEFFKPCLINKFRFFIGELNPKILQDPSLFRTKN